jgi:hypothetical protein
VLENGSSGADYLRQNNAQFTIVTIGGAVNTVLIQSRDTTHDVDFITPELAPPDLEFLKSATLYAHLAALDIAGGRLA